MVEKEEEYRESLAGQIKQNGFSRREIYLWDDISPDIALIVNRAIEKFRENDIKRKEKLPIIFRINSLGGDMFSCLSIISAIESCQKDGYIVKSFSYGIVASAALFIHLSASQKYRFGQKYTRYLLHEPSVFSAGFSSVENQKRQYLDMRETWMLIKEIIKSHTKITSEFLDNISKYDRDYYFWHQEAVELSITDKIF